MAKSSSAVFSLISCIASSFVSRALMVPNIPDIPLSSSADPVPVVIWHGLGDRFDNPGLKSLSDLIVKRYPETFVHVVQLADDGNNDQRATFLGKANDDVTIVCDQLANVPELSNGFDAIGLSQGGQFMRAYVERCNNPPVRNLITLGSQHLGVSALPPCKGVTDLFCNVIKRLVQGRAVYGDYAQTHVIPAQYYRNQMEIENYLTHNAFLADINNERLGDDQPTEGGWEGSSSSVDDSSVTRNTTYKENLMSLDHFVMFKFTEEKTVIPSTSSWFTLPNLTASLPLPVQPIPLPLHTLPLYSQDYIGLKALDESNRVHFGECVGEHMQINRVCWEDVLDWVGTGKRPQQGSHSEMVFQLFE